AIPQPIVVVKRSPHLFGQLVVQRIDQVADVVDHVAVVQSLAASKPGIEDVLEVLDDRDHHLVLRQRTMPQMIGAVVGGIRGDDARGQYWKLFLEAEVGCHATGPFNAGGRSTGYRPPPPSRGVIERVEAYRVSPRGALRCWSIRQHRTRDSIETFKL